MDSPCKKEKYLQIIYFLTYPYYTAKCCKIQAFLAKKAFFVDFDGYLCQLFYVNPTRTAPVTFYHFQLFYNILRYEVKFCTKYSSCNFSFIFKIRVSNIYLFLFTGAVPLPFRCLTAFCSLALTIAAHTPPAAITPAVTPTASYCPPKNKAVISSRQEKYVIHDSMHTRSFRL